MDYYAAYLKERENVDVIKHEHGFALIKPLNNALYIQDIYVMPEYRQKGAAKSMLHWVEGLAKEKGYGHVLGSCDPVAKGATVSMKAMLACGFELQACDGGLIYLIKSVGA